MTSLTPISPVPQRADNADAPHRQAVVKMSVTSVRAPAAHADGGRGFNPRRLKCVAQTLDRANSIAVPRLLNHGPW